MDIISLVAEQMEASHKKVKGLVSVVDPGDWYTIPKGINSNIAWQVGHLIISKPFQLVLAPIGKTKDVYDVIPFGDYLKLYGIGTKPSSTSEGFPDSSQLLNHFEKVQGYCLEKIKSVDNDALHEPTAIPHPIAKTKYDSLMWSFQHEVWHCGQISMIRRALGQPLVLNNQ